MDLLDTALAPLIGNTVSWGRYECLRRAARHDRRTMVSVSRNRILTLLLAFAAAVIALTPAAQADPGSPSYNQGKQAIDDAAHQGPLHVTDLTRYCNTLLGFELKSGQVARVDSPPDFIAGCQDEGRVLLPSN
jgi:hypothetical protein